MLKVRDTEVDKRHAGCGVVVGDKLYLWGGETEEKITVPEDEEEEEEEEEEDEEEIEEQDLYRVVNLPRSTDNNHPFDVFDLTNLTWSYQKTHGILKKEVPALGNGSTLSHHEGKLYLYGGWNQKKFSSDVYCVSMDTWRWEQITVPEGAMKPSPRYLTGVLIHENKLCNFGGVGPDIVMNQDVGAYYRGYVDKGVAYLFGWNNEYYEFNFTKRKWTAPMSGSKKRPPALGGHVFTKFDKNRAVLFGGRTEFGRTDNTWIFDLDRKEFQGPLDMDVKPRHRTFATLCPLIDPEVVGQSLCPGGPPMQQTLLLLWGKEHIELIVPDCWLFHGSTMTWTKLELGEVGRYWHIACPYFCNPGKSAEGQVVIYGGCKHDDSVKEVQFYGLRDLTILSFGVKSLKKLCLSVIVRALEQHGDPDFSQLPDDVPTVKELIITAFRAHTCTAAHGLGAAWRP